MHAFAPCVPAGHVHTLWIIHNYHIHFRNNLSILVQAHGGEENIKHHPFFRDVKWKELEERKVKPPFKPKIVRHVRLKETEI